MKIFREIICMFIFSKHSSISLHMSCKFVYKSSQPTLLRIRGDRPNIKTRIRLNNYKTCCTLYFNISIFTNTNDEKWETFQTVNNCLPILVNIKYFWKWHSFSFKDIWSFFQIWFWLQFDLGSSKHIKKLKIKSHQSQPWIIF